MITGVILARNEARNIVDCIRALRPHVGEVILIDMESADETAPLARPLVDRVLVHPLISNFDSARNIAIPEAKFDWLWFVDADERISARTGEVVKQLVREQGHTFEAITIPFKSYFCGQWMQHCGWWPGYTMPRVLKRGFFSFASRLHGGVDVQGRQIRLAPDPELGVDHFSYLSIEHYLEKLNRYTTTEARQLAEQKQTWSWREAARQMMRDLWWYYEHNPGQLDGDRGWILSWLSGQYRWISQAKLIDIERSNGSATAATSVPHNLDEVMNALQTELAALRAPAPDLPLGIVWRSPIWDPSGYADEGRTFAKALSGSNREIAVEELRWSDQECCLNENDNTILRALLRARRPKFTAAIANCIPTLCEPDPTASLNILRTTFETDRIPTEWLPRLEKFDEIWVISRHNAEAFRRSWVPPEKIRIVPSCLDTTLYAPDGPCLELPKQLADRFIFLSVFDWQWRKAWDVLLRAYTQEFKPDEGIGLLLKISRAHGRPFEDVCHQADQVLAEIGQSLAMRPDIMLWDVMLDAPQMAALYRSVDAFVLPSRGEGWGRPYLEAMACGLPVIGTAASGNMDFMNEHNSFLVPATLVVVPDRAVREIPVYSGQRWYEPDASELRRQLRRVFSDSPARECVARRAVQDAQQFDLLAGRKAVETAISAAEKRFARFQLLPATSSKIQVELEGEFFAGHSFAHVNEQLALLLANRAEIDLSLARVQYNATYDRQSYLEPRLRPYFGRTLDGGSKITIRHAFPPRWERPERGRWVHIQPWEYGYLPRAWVTPLRDEVDEIWVPSNYVRGVFEKSGIPAEKIHVIPWGVDTEVFHLNATPLLLATEKTFRFLFLGGAIYRKGIDIALQAYIEEFGPDDDVCFVIKDMGRETFYRDSPRDMVLHAAADPKNPAILYFDQFLTAGQLASLYTACDCLVAPYRGEGFGLPILEAMACGVVPIVPRGGASDDFVRDDLGIRIPSSTISTSHEWALCGPATELLVEVADLRRAMRSAYERRSELKQRGRTASQHVLGQFTWTKTVDRMVTRLLELSRPTTIATPMPNGQPALERSARWSAVVPVEDQERALADCLARLMPFAAQVTVVQNSRLGRCADIAKEYGAHYENQTDDQGISWQDRIRSQSTIDWIVWLPGPLALTEQSIDRIEDFARNCESPVEIDITTASGAVVRISLERKSKNALAEDRDFLTVYRTRFGPSLHQRAATWEQVFRHLLALGKDAYRIVETGCIRRADDWTAGQSTVLFDHFVQLHGGRVISVDIAPKHCELARRTCSTATQIVQHEAVQFLHHYARENPASIDLLYLDSLDIDWNNPHPAALQQFQEFTAAAPALHSGSMIVVDDHRNDDGRPGSSLYLAAYLTQVGAKQLIDDYQAAWEWP
jgi:glycosyltransferase involved in cell wall biosynthesis/predicted O-methyltransferase YrrM